MLWVDTARGIGIMLVVYAHALRGHVTSGAVEPAWHAGVQDAVIYAFHMPLFFFLAGLFTRHSLRKGSGAYLREKALTIAYPYLLWSVISVALGVLATGDVNHPMTWSALTTIWYVPVYQFWFLYALLLCQLAALVTRADWRATMVLCVLSALGVGIGPGMPTIALSYYIYFGLGILLAPHLGAVAERRAVLVLIAAGSAIALGTSFVIDLHWADRALTVGRALMGSALVVAVSMVTGGKLRLLAMLGTASMAIYVMHTIVSAAIRIGSRAAGITENLSVLIVGTLAGLFIPFVVWLIARRLRVLPILGLGSQPRARAKVAA